MIKRLAKKVVEHPPMGIALGARVSSEMSNLSGKDDERGLGFILKKLERMEGLLTDYQDLVVTMEEKLAPVLEPWMEEDDPSELDAEEHPTPINKRITQLTLMLENCNTRLAKLSRRVVV